jgi:hypothetical protein
MTSGAAVNKEYVIYDNTTSTIVVNGGTLSTDGVLAADTFKVINTGRGNVTSACEGYRVILSNCKLTSMKPRLRTEY